MITSGNIRKRENGPGMRGASAPGDGHFFLTFFCPPKPAEGRRGRAGAGRADGLAVVFRPGDGGVEVPAAAPAAGTEVQGPPAPAVQEERDGLLGGAEA